MTDDCMGCRKPGQYSHAAYCPESRVEELRRDFEIEIEVNGVLRSRLAEAEALLREARVKLTASECIRRHPDYAKNLVSRIDAFLAPDSAPHRENERDK